MSVCSFLEVPTTRICRQKPKALFIRVNFDPKDISNEQCTVSTSLIPSVNIRSSASACNSPEAQVTVRRSKDQATVRSKQ
ncbi:hypothetical protein ACO02O_05918 [Dirofilaria immitis]